jgi:transcriptional regulator with XRE-family HTH domain
MSVACHDHAVDGFRVGAALRALRLKRRWTQEEAGRRAGVGRSVISQAEHGKIGRLQVDTIEAIVRAFGGWLDLRVRSMGDDLERLVNREHSALHERMARFLRRLSCWEFAPEVSFAIYGERGIIDILAFHRATRRLLVIELKTLLVDVQEIVGVIDRYRRVALQVAADRGWRPVGVSVWLVVTPSRTNERRIAAHRTMLRTAFPLDGRAMRRWLRDPIGDVAAMSSPPDSARDGTGGGIVGRKRASKAIPRTIRGEAGGRFVVVDD